MEFECPVCFLSHSINDGIVYCCPFGEQDKSNDIHGICIDCIRNLAKVATEDAAIAKGGIGLLCPSCDNVIPIESFEFYLAEDIFYALTKRLQHASIVEAGLNDISVCTECKTEVWIDRDVQFYDCFCGRRQCRNCPRIYDQDHEGVSCAELDRQQSPSLEAKLSEIAIRICSNCKVRFIQKDGCNKMQCQCGAKQCYVCKETIKDYSHFCQCGWKGTSGQCPKCKRSCPLYGVAQHKDNIMMEAVKAQFDMEETKHVN